MRKPHLDQVQKFGNLLFQMWIFDSEANKSRQGVLLIYRQIRQLYFSTQSNAKAVSVSKSGFILGYSTLLKIHLIDEKLFVKCEIKPKSNSKLI